MHSNEPLAFIAGIFVGILLGTMIWGIGILPIATDSQFNKDCKAMAHGAVDKSAKSICVKNGKILFHQ